MKTLDHPNIVKLFQVKENHGSWSWNTITFTITLPGDEFIENHCSWSWNTTDRLEFICSELFSFTGNDLSDLNKKIPLTWAAFSPRNPTRPKCKLKNLIKGKNLWHLTVSAKFWQCFKIKVYEPCLQLNMGSEEHFFLSNQTFLCTMDLHRCTVVLCCAV